jgi:hypothetical protein
VKKLTDYSSLRSRPGYGLEALPNAVDVQIRDLLRGVSNAEEFERIAIEIPSESWNMLSVFAQRAASLAVRNRSVTDLRAGLVAVQLALVLTDDYREVLPAVSLLYRAAQLIDVDPAPEFHAVGALAGNPPGNHLTQYLERDIEIKRIERMGFVEGADDSGFKFVYTG